jgi:hypothetical protein
MPAAMLKIWKWECDAPASRKISKTTLILTRKFEALNLRMSGQFLYRWR